MIIPYIEKTVAPISLFSNGKVAETVRLASQWSAAAIEITCLLILLGKISETTTHMTTPQVN